MTTHPITDRTIDYEEKLEDYLTSDFDAVMQQTGLDLLLVERQPKLLGSRLDLLALEKNARPWVIELKLAVATPKIIAQALRYANIISNITAQELTNHSRKSGRLDLPARFLQKYGYELTEVPKITPGIMLIAEDFDTETLHSIAALKAYEAPWLAYRYSLSKEGIQLTLADKPNPSETDISLARQPVPARCHSSKSTAEPAEVHEKGYKVYIHEDVKKFWEWFSCTYPNPIAPIALIIEHYAAWKAKTTSRLLTTKPFNLGIFAREIRKLATTDNAWVRVYFRQDCSTEEASDPAHVLEARSRRGYPYTKAAYVKSEHLRQNVNLVV